jgi:catechol 2,3-dioxygenase-like lactoylglutathione lyase family enzyme
LEHIAQRPAIAGKPNRNIDFYTRVLGLRLVKKTVNFDDPGTYRSARHDPHFLSIGECLTGSGGRRPRARDRVPGSL